MAAFLQLGSLSATVHLPSCRRRASRRPLSPPLRFVAPPLSDSSIGSRLVSTPSRISRFASFSASRGDSKPLNAESKKDENENGVGAKELEEAWLKALEYFRDGAIKMKSISQEASEVYSKKAAIILNETAEKLRYHADNARDDLALIAGEINEGGKQFVLSTPEVKESLEAIASAAEPKGISALRDFHIGLIYGIGLAVGGFLSFMVTGDTAGIRFGVIIGSVLAHSSLSSYRSWKSTAQSSNLYTQAALMSIIFVRETWLLFSSHSYLAFLRTILSAAAVAFMVYRIALDKPGPVEQGTQSDGTDEVGDRFSSGQADVSPRPS